MLEVYRHREPCFGKVILPPLYSVNEPGEKRVTDRSELSERARPCVPDLEDGSGNSKKLIAVGNDWT